MAWFNEDFWDEWQRMHDKMENLSGRGFSSGRPLLGHRKDRKIVLHELGFRMPVCHMHQTPASVITTFEIPGVDKGDIQLNVNKDSIEVRVEKKKEKEVKKKGVYSYASASRQFCRRVPLPVDVKADKATAEYKDGILKVEIPKVKVIESKAKRIPVK